MTTKSDLFLWSIDGGKVHEFMVTQLNAVIYAGEWVSESQIGGTFTQRHHFLTPKGVLGRDSHLFDWDCFEPVT